MAISFKPGSFADDSQVMILRRLIWLYFWLLIFEGALRKWVPALSVPFLVVRDPLVLLIYLQAVRCRRFPINGPVLAYFFLMVCFILLAVTQLIAGVGGGPVVAAYGLRTNFLHLPLIFIIPQAFSYDDVLKLGRWLLILSIPMCALMILQYSSSPGSWSNAGASADSEQIAFALGKIRAAGTFSFISGAAHFFVLVTAFVVYAIADRTSRYPRWLVGAALLSVLIVQPVSGSRTLVLGCGLMLVAVVTFAILNPAQVSRVVTATFLISAAILLLSFVSFFREAQEVFMVRWNQGDAASTGPELGLLQRFLGIFLEPFGYLREAGWIGKGIGLGTNAGAALVTGSPAFLLAEDEWARVVLEAGPFLGFSFLIYRLWLAAIIAFRSARGARLGQLLPWLLAWDACRSLATDQISQPTNLGFMVFVSGLCLASFREPSISRASRQVRPLYFMRYSPVVPEAESVRAPAHSV